MIDARDVATAAVAALTSVPAEGRVYTLTGPEAISFDEVADVVGQRVGRVVRHVRVPAEVVCAVARGRGRGVVRRGHGCAARHARRRVRGRRDLRYERPDRRARNHARPVRGGLLRPLRTAVRAGEAVVSAMDARKARHSRTRARLDALKRWRSTPAAAFPPVVPASVTDYPFRRPARPRR